MAKSLIIIGILFIAAGVIFHLGWFKYIPLGRLPGDIKVEGKHGSFYFPIVTCILVSLILSFILKIFK